MKRVLRVLVLCLLDFSCVVAISCPPTASSLDEPSRDKILETVNRDRELIRRGELLLTNGQYALQGANMKNLTWDCNVEAAVAEKVHAMCNGSYGQYSIFEVPYSTSLYRYGNVALPITDHANYWISSNDFNASTFLQLATDTQYRAPSNNQFMAYYLSDVGQTIGCATYECLDKNWVYLICKTSPSVGINETIYVPTEVVIPPPSEPVCSVPDTLLTPAHRAKLVNSMNEKRAQALNGTLRLYDGKYAVQALQMPMLTWDCDLEANIQTIVKDRCTNIKVSYSNESLWNEHERYNTIDYYVHIFSKTDIAGISLKVLANNSNGIILNYHMLDQRLLHDKATKVGCAIDQCDYKLSAGKYSPLTQMVCTFDVNWMPLYNGTKTKIYNSINDIVATTVPPAFTTTAEIEATTTPKAPPAGCTTSYGDITTTVKPEPAKCLDGYVYFEATDSCYGRDPQIGNAWNTWPKAEQYCERQGGHLASIHSEEENKLIVSLGAPFGWGVWVGLYSVDENYTWKWSDATPVDYVPWLYGADHPMNPDVNVSCAYAYPYYDPRGSLINNLCNNQQYYVCQLPALN